MKNIKVNDIQSLSHTTWNCKYHIVFAPKYMRKVFYESKRLEIGQILRKLCEWKGKTSGYAGGNLLYSRKFKQRTTKVVLL